MYMPLIVKNIVVYMSVYTMMIRAVSIAMTMRWIGDMMSRLKPSQYIEKGWCQGCSAITLDGRVVSPNDPLAAKWCLSGAIQAAYPNEHYNRGQVVDKITKKLGDWRLALWNDMHDRTKSEILDLLRSIGE